MAVKTKTPKTTAAVTNGILPVPETVIKHHGESLFPLMREWLATRKIPPVLLFTGATGVGKRHIAYLIAQWILCERSGWKSPSSLETPLPCGECSQCVRALKGSWVDFTEILPDTDGETTSSSLKVDQFRDLKASQGFGAHEGSYRIILIPNADRMTAQAANSMLKLLEEPPTGWIFFLTANDPTLILPTVLSRCQNLRLKPFTKDQLKTLLALSGAKSDRLDICAELSCGSWGKALVLAGDEQWEQRRRVLDFISEPSSCVNELIEWAALEPRNYDLLVDQLEQLTLELLRWSIEGDKYQWINSDGKLALSSHALKAVSERGSTASARAFWMDRAERLAKSRSESRAPLNRKLLVQDLLLPWLDLKA